jgi:hypothetical protein
LFELPRARDETRKTDNRYDCGEPRSQGEVQLTYRSIPMRSTSSTSLNLPDLEHAVESHWSSGHLLATLPASLLSMRQGLWRLST